MSLRSLHIFIFGLGFCCCAVAQSKRVGQQGGSVIALETEVYSMSTAALLPYRAVVNDQIRNEYYRHLPALQQGLALTYRYRWQGVALGLQLGHQDWGRQELLFPKFQELRFSNGRVFPVPSDRARTDIHLAMLSTGLFVQHNFAWGQRVALGYRLGYAGWWLYRRRVATIYTGALQAGVGAERRPESAWMEASPRWLGLLELAPSVRVYTDASQKTFVELQPFLRVPLRPVLALDPDWDEKTEQQILQTYDHAGWHYGVRLTMGLRD